MKRGFWRALGALVLAAAMVLPTVFGAAEASPMTFAGAVAAGDYHSLYLQPSGTVVAAGYDAEGRCNVSSWDGIVKIAAGGASLGLRFDGTVMLAGGAEQGMDVSRWTGIADIDVFGYNAIGLRRDGTVLVTGPGFSGAERTAGWQNIVQVAADDCAFYGLTRDGRVLTVSGNSSSKTRCMAWNNIVAIDAAPSQILGLRRDGTVAAEGSNVSGQLEVDGWTNIVAVAAGNRHSVGLRSDGTVVAVGWNEYGQCDVEGWTDIIAIAAGMTHTVGLRSDGTIVATGSDGCGQCGIRQARWIPGDYGTWPIQNSGIRTPGIYLNEMPHLWKHGKLWTRSETAPAGHFHTKIQAPECWSDPFTPGHTGGPVTDQMGNTYTYGLHLDGSELQQYAIAYSLGGSYTAFSGICAYPGTVINDTYTALYSKRIEVYGDGRLLYVSPLIGCTSAPVPFQVNVTGIRTLAIVFPATEGPNEACTLYDAMLF